MANPGLTRASWLRGVDSRRIALLYLGTIGLFMICGAIAALILQLELFGATSRLISNQLFSRLLTQHGLVMAFVVLVPLLPAVIGNLVLPSAVGSRQMAWTRLNLVGWACHLVGALMVLISVELGAYDTGWTMVMPPPNNPGLFAVLVIGLLLVALSTLIISLVIAVTVISRKHRTVSISHLPVIAWFFLVASLVVIIVSPIRIVTLIQMMLAQQGATFLFSLKDAEGVLRYQHLFWAYAGPVTYASILPAIGVILEILSTCSGTAVFARRIVIISGVVLGQLSLVSWGQHLLTADAERMAVTGSFFGLLTAVPMSLILLSWLFMLIRTKSPRPMEVIMIWLQTLLLAIGGMVGVLLAAPVTGASLHSTYTTTGHLHLVVLGGVFMSFLAALYHWWPNVMRVAYSVRAARIATGAIFVGIVMTYVPMLVNGLHGSPSALNVYPIEFQTMHRLSSAGSILLVAGLLGTIGLFAWSAWLARKQSTIPNMPNFINETGYAAGGPPIPEEHVK